MSDATDNRFYREAPIRDDKPLSEGDINEFYREQFIPGPDLEPWAVDANRVLGQICAIARQAVALTEMPEPWKPTEAPEPCTWPVGDCQCPRTAVPDRFPDERTAQILAAVSVASMQNTRESAKDRIGPDNPYWTQAYGDVCTAVDREMQHREHVEQLTAALQGATARIDQLVASQASAVSDRSRVRDALAQTGVGLMATTTINPENGHSWVSSSHPTGDVEIDLIEWCQWCGTHKAEVPDWMDNPLCRGISSVRELLTSLVPTVSDSSK